MKKTASRSTSPAAALPLRRTALAVLVAGCFGAAQANPTLPQLVHGQATFNQQGNLFTITNTPNTIINWQSFSINPGEVTRFVQQNAASSVLNRITGQDPSQILGALQSNGKVLLINPNGVLFGRDARVDVGGLIASSLNLSNQDFLDGKMQFNAGDTAGAVRNAGAITTGRGGQVLLIAPDVENSGIITTPDGEVILAAGRSVQLADPANPSLQVVLSAPGDQAVNVGQVIAQGGQIGMLGALVRQGGALSANSAVVGENGRIVLKASGKALLEAGSVTTVSNAAGKGGAVTVQGEQVGMQGDARIDASGLAGGGTVLLGGDYQGRNPDIANARQVAVSAGASIAADAIGHGDGGKVIVWGDETARVAGSISARGGALAGNGGLVETSGHYLAVDGIRVDTSAAKGKRGNWLLDPYDINVVAGSGSSGTGDVDEFADAPSGGTAVIGAAVIAGAQSDVTLQATHRININSAINMVNDNVGLKAQAGETIAVNADITTRGGNIVLSANDAASGAAAGLGANVILNGALSSNNGAIELSGATITGAGVVNVGNGNLGIKSNFAGGNIYLTGTGNQLVGSGINDQRITLQADGMSFAGGINFGGAAGNAALAIAPLTDGRAIHLGDVPGGMLGLDNAELNRIAVASVHIGSATAGDITVSAPVDLADLSPNGGIRQLSLETGGKLAFDNMLVLRQPGSILSATAAGSLNVGSGGGLYAAAAVNLTADNMNLGGAAQSISTADGGSVTLKRQARDGVIEIGNGAADSAGTLGLSDAELKTINASTLTVGSDIFSGKLKLKGALDLSTAASLGRLQLSSGGEIELAGPLTVPHNLDISAGGDGANGAISASGAVNVGGNFSLNAGNWQQNSATLPAFYARGFTINGGSFLRVAGGNGDAAQPYLIADIYGLQGIGGLSRTNQYQLAGNIDASGTQYWRDGAGFVPLFNSDEGGFGGVLDGAGHAIASLHIDTTRYGYSPMGSGLFSQLQGGTLQNLELSGGSVTGERMVGALVGNNRGGTIDNVQSSVVVGGSRQVGGLVGRNSGSISNASTSGAVSGVAAAIGSDVVVGEMVSGSQIGGLVGSNDSGASIKVARATGSVSGVGEQVGGLVGNNDGGITVAYATGNVAGGASTGGLVGRNGDTIADVYATGTVSGAENSSPYLTRANLGGVIGWSVAGSSATRLYFDGTVSGNGFAYGTVGAVVGRADPGAAVGLSYFNYEKSGTFFDQGGSSGRSTAGMQQQASFNGLQFGGADAVWRIYDGYTTPMLKAFLTPLQVTADGVASQVYNGQQAVFNGTLSYSGLVGSDTGVSGSAGYKDARNVGIYDLGGLWSTKYDISYAGTTTLSITPRQLSVVVGGSKVYDGKLDFANATFTLDGVVGGDTLSVSGTAKFADKNAGTGKQVEASNIALGGNDLGNYTVDVTASGKADISRAGVGLASVSAGNKVYDGKTSASLSGVFSGVIDGDQIDLSNATADFSDKNVANNKTVKYVLGTTSLGGQDAGNYMLETSSGEVQASITPRDLNLSFTGVNKVYDGKTVATVGISDNRIEGDVLTASASAAFDNKNAGSGKAVTVKDAALSGDDAANYRLVNTGGNATADIGQRELNLSFAGVNKVYDGKTDATVVIGDDRIAEDKLTFAATATFADKNADNTKAVTVRAVMSSEDAGNYKLVNTEGNTTAAISQRELNLSFAGVNKVYDGKTDATVVIGDDRIADDKLTFAATATFADKNAGNTRAVTVREAVMSGEDAGNYKLVNTVGSTTADITQRALNLSFTGANKVYDGTTATTVGIVDNRVAGDVLTASANAAFADKNAGNGKAINVQNATLSGTDAANYTLVNTSGSVTADIAQRALNLSFTGANKVYDGTTATTVGIVDNRVAGDVLTASANAAFADKNAGSGKTINVQNATLSGTDAANYTLVNTSGSVTADITQRALNLNFTGANKVYDGTTATAVAIGDNRVTGDVLAASANAAFADKNAGSAKTINVQNASLSGTDAANYTLVNTSGSATADIAQRALNLSFTGANKVYDGTTATTVGIGDNRVAGDILTASANAAFADKNAGSGKAINVQNATLSGTDAANYTLVNTSGSAMADITQRALNLSFTGANKVYDGTTATTVGIGDNRVAGDVLTASANAAFADKNAGSGKTISVQNASLSGTDAANYTLVNTSGSTKADITQRALNLSFTGANKVYDGTTATTVGIVDNRVAGDILTAAASAAFADKNAGSGKAINVQNATLFGVDAANYTLVNTSGSATADIAQRALNLSFTGANKVYDGTTATTVGIVDNRVAGDILTAAASAAFADKNAGSGKTINVQNATLSGVDAANYTLVNTSGSATADIAQRALSLSFTGANKVYDGTTAATVGIADNRIAGDSLTASASAAFADKNAGSGKAITVQNASLSGVDAGNYRLDQPGGTATGTISQATLVLGNLQASDKVYDATLAASVSGSLAGIVGQDAVSLAGGTGAFADRNVGSGKTVTVSGFALAGQDAGNYVLNTTGGVAQASIAQRALSTWIGASGGLWSDAANWADGVAPSGSNVLAANLAGNAGSVVVYNAAAGDTVLGSLSTRGGLQIGGGSLTLQSGLDLTGSGLNISGGSLLMQGALSVGSYVQSGGLLAGSGNLLVANSFNQLAGAINLNGNLAINQASGDLRVAGLSGNSISLNASGGQISQSGAIVANALTTQSQSGTLLSNTGNQVRSFTASNSGAGGITLINSTRPAQLVLGSLATGAGNIVIDNQGGIESHAINANGGNVSLSAHSPVQVQGVISGNDISLDASTEVAFGSDARVNATRDLSVTAGSDITLDGAAALNAGNKLTMTAARSVLMNGASTMDVQATGAMAVLAQNGDLTALADVRINTRGAPLSLLAPNGRVSVPDSVIVRQNVAADVPSSLLDAAKNYLTAVTEQYSPANTGSGSYNNGDALLVSVKPEEKSDGKKNGIQKTYCN